jgi:hypothetical protein
VIITTVVVVIIPAISVIITTVRLTVAVVMLIRLTIMVVVEMITIAAFGCFEGHLGCTLVVRTLAWCAWRHGTTDIGHLACS